MTRQDVVQDLIGHRLGPYKILELLGVDALTEVYKGFHTERNYPVVVKIVGRSLEADPVFSARFRREARAIAGLQHPNIVRVHDFGQSEGGHYMVMDYVEGVSLAERLAGVRRGEQGLAQDDVAFIIRQIASALDHAHSRGVVHRAVTPDTIILTRSGQAILTDFGLSLLASRGADEARSPALFSQPEYMAPELHADARAASPASDIYSLGVVLYELLVGERPYELESDIDLALRDLADTAPDPRLLNPDIPQPVALVVLKALATSPRRRFNGAMKLAVALERAYRNGVAPEPAQEAVERVARRSHAAWERPDARRPTVERIVVRRGLSRREARRERRRLRDEHRRLKREAQVQGEEAVPAARGSRVQGWVRTISVLAIVFMLLSAGAYLLQTLGVMTFPFAGAIGLPGSSQADTPTAMSSPTPAPTSSPTPTLVPTATPLQAAESTPIPALAYASLEVGASAFRLADGAVIHFVPAGTFLMGTNDTNRKFDAQPQHPVMLSDYWIDETEVTNARYALCVEDGLCPPPIDLRTFDSPNYANHPVTYIRHTMAVTYCLWLAQETGEVIGLPTEAQWEKAAIWDPVAGVQRRFPWGDEPPNQDLVRYAGSAVRGAAPVGTYLAGASPYGALDMAGNVWEWVADWYDADAYKRSGVATNPTGPASGVRRVTRGGGWFNDETLLLSTVRNWATPTAAGDDLGFRCAMNTRHPSPDSDIYLTPLELSQAIARLITAGYEAEGNDRGTLDEWQVAIAMLDEALSQGRTDLALTLIDDRLVRLTIHRSSGLLDPGLALRLDGSLMWMRKQIAPPTDS